MSDNLVWLLYKFMKTYIAFASYPSGLTLNNHNDAENEFLEAWNRRHGEGDDDQQDPPG